MKCPLPIAPEPLWPGSSWVTAPNSECRAAGDRARARGEPHWQHTKGRWRWGTAAAHLRARRSGRRPRRPVRVSVYKRASVCDLCRRAGSQYVLSPTLEMTQRMLALPRFASPQKPPSDPPGHCGRGHTARGCVGTGSPGATAVRGSRRFCLTAVQGPSIAR